MDRNNVNSKNSQYSGDYFGAKDIMSRRIQRWTAKSKLELILAIKNNRVRVIDVIEVFDLSAEELFNWIELYDKFGARELQLNRRNRRRKNQIKRQ